MTHVTRRFSQNKELTPTNPEYPKSDANQRRIVKKNRPSKSPHASRMT
jgi:hypothetical protein